MSDKISDEMIEAGVEAAGLANAAMLPRREAVQRIYTAMSQAHPTDEEEVVEEFLAELEGWESAYPLSAFPEPDLKLAAQLLKAGGMTLDAVSASNMRHVVSCIAPKARAALNAIRGK